MNFEETLKKLSSIVESLESDTVSLDKAIKQYHEGMRYAKQCLELLEKAEKKIQIVVKDKSGATKYKPFKHANDTGEN